MLYVLNNWSKCIFSLSCAISATADISCVVPAITIFEELSRISESRFGTTCSSGNITIWFSSNISATIVFVVNTSISQLSESTILTFLTSVLDANTPYT